MHYGGTAFSRNGQATIVPFGGQAIGQRNGLSAGDIAAVRALYPQLEVRMAGRAFHPFYTRELHTAFLHAQLAGLLVRHLDRHTEGSGH